MPPEERVAVFDNDGTLWCEKPMPIELGFILLRLAEMAEKDPSLRDKQPWQAAYERDYAWLGGVIDKHYAGDDSDVKVLLGGMLQAFAGQTVDEYGSAAAAFLAEALHPTLGRRLRECAYVPMIDLLRYLEGHGFTCFIASGGSRDFMRAITGEIYAIPPERVVGSSNGLRYTDDDNGGALTYLAEPDFFDDGPVKPVRIWSRIGRRPIVAGGNSNGDVPMLRFAGGNERPSVASPRPARRSRARVRLREGRGDRARACPRRGLDRRQRQGGLGDRVRGRVAGGSLGERRPPRASSSATRRFGATTR